jgi:putative tryptophan/tyrosine transport system substrate-binding protein
VKRATSRIPIVMATYGDAVATGIVASLSHPGGNIAGSTFFNPELMAKRLELIKEIVPSITRAGVLLSGDALANGPTLRAMNAAANTLQVELQPFEMGKAADLEPAFSAWAAKQVGAVVVGDHGILILNARTIIPLAAKYRIPLIGPLEFPASDGLMSYGVNFFDQFRRAATFVDKILRGARPSDIPVERATKFTTTINMRTAKTLGIEIPTSILLRADEVIE